MPESDIKITGIPEFQKKMDQLAYKRLSEMAYKALYEGAKLEQATIQANAPVEASEPSPKSTALPQGAIKNDIHIERTKTAQNEPAYLVIPGSKTRHVARFLEFGHALVRGGYRRAVKDRSGNPTGKHRGSGQEVGRVQPHPFLRRSWEECAAAVKARIAEVMTEQLNQIVGR